VAVTRGSCGERARARLGSGLWDGMGWYGMVPLLPPESAREALLRVVAPCSVTYPSGLGTDAPRLEEPLREEGRWAPGLDA
jgi:hypothetical protein